MRSAVLLLLLGLNASAADPIPLPAPTPLPEGAIPIGLRSPADDAAELPFTRDCDTFVYVVNGLDPFHWAHLKRLAERICVSGFPNTKYGEYFDVPAFETEIRKIRAVNPHARIALIGYSAGCYTVLASAHRLIRDGHRIDMIGYIGGDFLEDNAYTRPPQVGRVVNITGNGFLLSGHNLFWNGTNLKGAANLRLRGVKHFDLPKRPETFKWLYEALVGIATVK